MSSRSEKRALEVYPRRVNEHSVVQDFDWNEEYRDVFQDGYEHAEKDLTLTVKDVERICKLFTSIVFGPRGNEVLVQDVFKKVLELYNEEKEIFGNDNRGSKE